LAEVTVATFLPGRNGLSQYKSLNHGDVEVLISLDLARYVKRLHIRREKFLMFKFLKAEAALSNGVVMGGPVPPSIGTIGNQPWVWRPR